MVVPTCPVINDIDNDGMDDIIVTFSQSSLDERSTMIYAYNRNGDMIQGWPQKINSYNKGTPSVGDINGDGLDEIVLSGLFNVLINNKWRLNVYGFDNEGIPLDGWPIEIDILGGSYGSSLIVDIDNDGIFEIIVPISKYLYVFNFDGSVREGWPYNYGASIASSPAVGDLTGDGNLEIILGESLGSPVVILNKDGNVILKNKIGLNLAVISSNVHSSPIVGDIDGDGNLDIVQAPTSSNEIYSLDVNGIKEGWPIKYHDGGSFGQIATPVISDVDGDGDTEIILGTRNGFLFIWDLDSNFNQSLNPWPQFQHDNQHTGCYDCDGGNRTLGPIQSKIVNNEDFDVTGRMVLGLRSRDSGGVIINSTEVFDEKITVPANGLIKLDVGEDSNGNQVFDGWNNVEVVSFGLSGPIEVYVSFEVDGELFEDSWEFEIV
jgi:hypothetical protein